MIKIEAFEGKFAPQCACDICGLPITHDSQGLVLFTAWPDGDVVAEVPHKLVHKGECRAKAVKQFGEEGGDSEAFTVLIQLLNNMGYRGDHLKGLIDGVEGIDL